jgi:hypothetical protein
MCVSRVVVFEGADDEVGDEVGELVTELDCSV